MKVVRIEGRAARCGRRWIEAAIQVVRDFSLIAVQGEDTFSAGARDLLWRGKSLEGLTAGERAGLLAR